AVDTTETESGAAIAPGATVFEAIEAVARSGGPARVMQDGRCVGVVDHVGLLAVVAGVDRGADTDGATDKAVVA
ncbi:MAG TPA: glycine/betaine ABC transporter ATP-binding protein, partial [Streptomyces sp.]|nr:glycine/betaine ABC transporter ATP-binding protein [Streptomyces sp.]